MYTVHDQKTGKTAIIGSTCVNQYATYRPDDAGRMLADLARIEAEIKARKRAARMAAQAEEVQRLKEDYAKLYAACRAAIDGYRKATGSTYLPHNLYWLRRELLTPDQLAQWSERVTTPTAQAARIRRHTASVLAMYQRAQQGK
jgi:hypothetical protein